MATLSSLISRSNPTTGEMQKFCAVPEADKGTQPPTGTKKGGGPDGWQFTELTELPWLTPKRPEF
jgi:hypothetical protein